MSDPIDTETDRLRLRPATPADMDFVAMVEASPAVSPFVWSDPAAVHAERLARPDFVYRIAETAAEGAVGFGLLSVPGDVHRSVCLKRVALAEPGRGLGRTLVSTLIDEAFQAHDAHRVWLDVYPENERARRVYRDLGFVEEGLQREAWWGRGRWHSFLVMSLLEDEWRSRRGA